MSTKIITYDLVSPGQDYDSLIAKIKSYNQRARVTESCWLIATYDSCEEIRDNLLSVMDSNDRLFVAELTGEAYWRNVIAGNTAVRATF